MTEALDGEGVEPNSALEETTDLIRTHIAAARRLAWKIEPESDSKEDLLATLSAVEIAIQRLEIEQVR